MSVHIVRKATPPHFSAKIREYYMSVELKDRTIICPFHFGPNTGGYGPYGRPSISRIDGSLVLVFACATDTPRGIVLGLPAGFFETREL